MWQDCLQQRWLRRASEQKGRKRDCPFFPAIQGAWAPSPRRGKTHLERQELSLVVDFEPEYGELKVRGTKQLLFKYADIQKMISLHRVGDIAQCFHAQGSELNPQHCKKEYFPPVHFYRMLRKVIVDSELLGLSKT